MGIPGLNTFVRENHLLESFHLRNTVLVIDGLNLENALYNGSLKLHNDKAFGGDYAYFSAYVETFFKTLADCAIKPVIIMDGSIQADKLRKKKARFNARLSRAKIISKTRNGNYGVNSLFNPHVFVQVIKRLRIPVYKCIFEADDILARIATDLGAPLLSADGDFLVSHLAAGVIDTGSLFWRGKLKVGTDQSGRYINCKLFKLEHLQKKFPGLKPELVSLGGAILGNDYLTASTGLINRLARRPAGSDELKHHEQIEIVFGWLSGQASVPDVLSNLKKQSAPNRLINFIENRLLNSSPPSTVSRPLSIEQYFTVNKSTLFKRDPAVPQWVHDAYVDERLHRRAMAIFLVQFDFLRALIEDYSIETSSYETVFELIDAIYGLLRSDDQNPMPVRRFVRSGLKQKEEAITPVIQIANKRLPLLPEISNLSKSDRLTLFYEILDIPASIQTEIKNLLTSTLPKSIIDQLMTLLLSTIYMCRHFSTDIWIEFVYALTANFLFMGHFTAKQEHPNVLNPRKTEHDQLFKSLKHFNTIPSSSVRFEARIVHQYNAFQNCLDNIAFLAQILDLADIFHADHLVSGLQGTVIYNLTIDLAFCDKPLTHLGQYLLGGLPFKYKKLFLAVLDLLLSHSERKLVTNRQVVSKHVIPTAFQVKNKSTCSAVTQFFVRGLPKKVSIKKVTPWKARVKRTKTPQPAPDPVTACQKTALIGLPKNSSSIWPEQFGPIAKDSTRIKKARNKVTRKKAFPKEPESLKNGSNFWPEQFGPVSFKAHPRGRRGGRRVNRQVAGVSLGVGQLVQ